jgi:hypothetical protein
MTEIYKLTGQTSSQIPVDKLERILKLQTDAAGARLIGFEIVSDYLPERHFFYISVEATMEQVLLIQEGLKQI